MGFRFRKSINLGGGFRINLSKSGVGYSWGVPGYRVTKTASGKTRKTYSIPGSGVSYVEENGVRKRGQPSNPLPNNYIVERDVLYNIESASIDEFQPIEYQALIDRITKILKINLISNLMIGCIIFSAASIAFLLVVVLGIALKAVIHSRGKIVLEYDLDECSEEKYKKRCLAWTTLNESRQLWQVTQDASVSNKKMNAGAARNINRRVIKILTGYPFYLKANVDVIKIKLLKETLILLPDKILIARGMKVGALTYDDVKIEISSTNFVESGIVPSDANVIDYTWQYVNKNGSPDKRFKNNRQMPICLYGQVFLKSVSGLNVEIQCSNAEMTKRFADGIS